MPRLLRFLLTFILWESVIRYAKPTARPAVVYVKSHTLFDALVSLSLFPTLFLLMLAMWTPSFMIFVVI